MSITAHVYQIYVAARPDQVWAAITDSDWTRRWFHGTAFAAPLQQGEPYRSVLPDGSPAVEGVVEELRPPAPGVPGRFVQTWHVLYADDLAAEAPGRVEWTVEEAGEGLTRIRLVHGDLHDSPQTWAEVGDGWVWVLDSLKTVLETGASLPRAATTVGSPAEVGDGAWHRRQGVDANNAAMKLLGAGVGSAAESEEVLRSAYAAAYHWDRAAGATEENAARAAYVISKALLATGAPEAKAA